MRRRKIIDHYPPLGKKFDAQTFRLSAALSSLVFASFMPACTNRFLSDAAATSPHFLVRSVGTFSRHRAVCAQARGGVVAHRTLDAQRRCRSAGDQPEASSG